MKSTFSAYAFIVVLLFSMGCKPEAKQEELVSKPVPVPVAKKYIVYEPAVKGAGKIGEVVFDEETFAVIEEYTDDVAYNQVVGNDDEGIMKYREKVIYLINKRTLDTTFVRQSMFKGELPDYDKMILQAALFDQPSKTGMVPFMISFCQPDTDYCYFFKVSIKEEKLNTVFFDENDFADSEE